MDKQHAYDLITVIKKYWRGRRYTGLVIDAVEFAPGLFTIRSNIGASGFPPH